MISAGSSGRARSPTAPQPEPPTTGFARKRIFGFDRKRLIFRTEARNVAAQGVFSTLCVPVLDISVRALSRASSEISETRHAFLSGESALQRDAGRSVGEKRDMDNASHNQMVSLIWNIADDVLRDVFLRGQYRDVILPMIVLRRLDALLEPTKEAVEASIKEDGIDFWGTDPS